MDAMGSHSRLLGPCLPSPTGRCADALGCGPRLRCSLPGRRPHGLLRAIDAAAPARSAGTPVPLDDPKARAFSDWAASSGVKLPKLSLATFEGVRGMMATADIAVDDATASVPRGAVIALEPRAKRPEWCAEEVWRDAPWFVRLALMLLREKALGAESAVWGYVASLPDAIDTPICWSPEEVAMMQYPPMAEAVREQEAQWDGLYASVAAAKMGIPVGREDFMWALACVRSRCFSGPFIGSTLGDRLKVAAAVGLLAWGNVVFGSSSLETTLNAVIAVALFNILYEVLLSAAAKVYVLCPGVDLMNHACRLRTDLSYDYFRDEYSVLAGEARQTGQQVFISYGEQSNDALMQFYGFVEADNPEDTYIIANMATHVGGHPLMRKSGLDRKKLDGLRDLRDVAVRREGFPEATLQALRGVLGSIGIEGGRVEAELQGLLAHACSEEMASMGTSLEEDVARLEAEAGEGGRAEWALRFRIEKKRVLAACLGRLGGGGRAAGGFGDG
ncbi:unnamed protein product [Ostreobium quekettii]|uniref:Rubisco LSMT substrate-binding domain-containing protein n=1 Tax=Ostreobium quekettii TaxID=121088 RepID=A0A8S1JAT0_9CHLO|nr:unnamed protein product [Ostreobium quekettii]|eukprot:evm.model.scf_44.2 EVM.evm.TU.scf_44.2   scf_44:22544-24052(-)